jgi:hypothetical protein
MQESHMPCMGQYTICCAGAVTNVRLKNLVAALLSRLSSAGSEILALTPRLLNLNYARDLVVFELGHTRERGMNCRFVAKSYTASRLRVYEKHHQSSGTPCTSDSMVCSQSARQSFITCEWRNVGKTRSPNSTSCR